MPISPNSLISTAVSASAGSSSSRLSSVVLPAPRKPVRTVSGIGATLGFVGLACAVFGAAGLTCAVFGAAGFVVFAASVLSDFTAEGLASAVLVLSLFLACFFGCLSIAAFASASPLPVGFFGPV